MKKVRHQRRTQEFEKGEPTRIFLQDNVDTLEKMLFSQHNKPLPARGTGGALEAPPAGPGRARKNFEVLY